MPHSRLTATTRMVWAAGIVALLLVEPAAATTKGLSQIVTPDLQPEGELSLSFQAQSRRIANPYELQAELGLTKWLEAAVFQGLSPNEHILGTQLALVQRGPYLLTTGFINWSTRGSAPQPLLEGGYYTEHDKFMAGGFGVSDRNEALLGWAHDFNATWRFQLDYQSGSENYFHRRIHLQCDRRVPVQSRAVHRQRSVPQRGGLYRIYLYIQGLEVKQTLALTADEPVAEAQSDGSGTVHRYRFVVLPVVRKQLSPRVGQVLSVNLHQPRVLSDTECRIIGCERGQVIGSEVALQVTRKLIGRSEGV